MMLLPQSSPSSWVGAASSASTAMLVRGMGTDAHLYDDPHDADIAALLCSKIGAEKAEAMKRLLALMSQGCDVSPFFPHVVKNVATPSSLELKKLLYIYLVHYAEKRPDEALLSINSFQKDLGDLNPLVRAWALRALSGIRVHAVAPLMLMAINKCARDPSAYVRRVAANAIPKLYLLDSENTRETLEKLIGLLLDDSSVGVIGAAVAAFIVVCPECYSIVASRFHRLCEVLPDLEDWGQVILMEIFLHYAIALHGLQHFSNSSSFNFNETLMIGTSRPQKATDEKAGVQEDAAILPNAFAWLDSDIGANKHYSGVTKSYCSDGKGCKSVNGDVNLLLRCTSPLLWNHNSAVVLAAATVHWFLAPKDETRKIVKPLIFLLRSFHDSHYVVLLNLVTFIRERPSLFEAYYEDFFVHSLDSQKARSIKLEILSLIAEESCIQPILNEFQAYVRDPDRQFVADTVNAIGRCAKKLPSIALKCLNGLLILARGRSGLQKSFKVNELTVVNESSRPSLPEGILDDSRTYSTANRDRESAVVIQAVLAIRAIVDQHFLQSEKVFAQLVRSIGCIMVPAARAIVIWMVGEYGWRSTLVCQVFPSIFKYFAACFMTEDTETKLQILNCVSKIVLRSQTSPQTSMIKTSSSILGYLLDLASNDMNYDVRDRSRMFQQIIPAHQKYDYTLLPKEQILSKEHEEMDNHKKTPSSSNAFLTEILLSPKLIPVSSSFCGKTRFIPGSMSFIVNHIAPGYRPLPKPLSFQDHMVSKCGGLELDEVFSESPADQTVSELESEESGEFSADSNGSGSSSEGIGQKDIHRNFTSQPYASQSDNVSSASCGHSSAGSELSNDRHASGNNTERLDDFSRYNNRENNEIRPLISFSDTENYPRKVDECKNSQGVDSMIQLRSSDDLESWLGPPLVLNDASMPGEKFSDS